MMLSIYKFDSGTGRLQTAVYCASTGTCFSLPSWAATRICDCKSPEGSFLFSEAWKIPFEQSFFSRHLFIQQIYWAENSYQSNKIKVKLLRYIPPLATPSSPHLCVFFFFVFCLLFLLLKHNWLLKSMYIDYYFLGDEEHIEISSERKDKWF